MMDDHQFLIWIFILGLQFAFIIFKVLEIGLLKNWGWLRVFLPLITQIIIMCVIVSCYYIDIFFDELQKNQAKEKDPYAEFEQYEVFPDKDETPDPLAQWQKYRIK